MTALFTLDFLDDLDDDEPPVTTSAVDVAVPLAQGPELQNGSTLEVVVAKDETVEPPSDNAPNTAIAIGVEVAIKDLVTSRFTSLQANPLNYYGYLQGQVIERIFDQIIGVLLSIYSDRNAANAEAVFKSYADKLQDKSDMNFIENHMVNLIERIIRLRIDGVQENGSEGEIIIPYIAIRRPPSRYKRRRFRRTLRVDECQRISKARLKQQQVTGSTNHALSDRQWRRKRKMLKQTEECENDSKRFMHDTKPLPGFEFDVEDEKMEHEELDIESGDAEPIEEPPVVSSPLHLPQRPSPQRPPLATKKQPRFSTSVSVIAQYEDINSFNENTGLIITSNRANTASIRPSINQQAEIPKPHSRGKIIDTSYRRELKKQAHICIVPVPPRVLHGGAAGAQQLTARQRQQQQPPTYRSQSSKSNRHRPSVAGARRRSPTVGHDRRRANVSSSDWLSDDEHPTDEEVEDYEENEENHSDWDITASRSRATTAVPKEDEDSDVSDSSGVGNSEADDDSDSDEYDYDQYQNTSVNSTMVAENYETPIGRVIVEDLAYRLKSCCTKRFFAEAEEAPRSVRYVEGHQMLEYEDDDIVITRQTAAESTKHTKDATTVVFTKSTTPLDANMRRNRNNRIMLPHSDEPTEISKRIDPRYMHASSLREHYADLRSAMTVMAEKCVFEERISRWFICDMLLDAIDDDIFRNAHVTRIQFPKLPTWLVDEGMSVFLDNKFPSSISRIFVSCGYDTQLLHADDKSLIPMEFLRKLHEWLRAQVANRTTNHNRYIAKSELCAEGDCYVSHCKRVTPIIVAINIPEVGDRERQFRAFNEQLGKFIDKINKQDDVRRHGQIELFDWAKYVREHEDQLAMSTVEGRTRVLITELKREYGLLYQ